MRVEVDLTDRRVIRALGHPLRASILAELDREQASPAALSRRLDAPLGTVSYHVRVLADLGLITLTKTTPRRGSIEHHYRAKPRAKQSEKAWSSLPPSARGSVAAAKAEAIADAVEQVVAADGLRRKGARLELRQMELDAQGWRELAAAMTSVQQQLDKLEAEAKERLASAPDAQSIEAAAVLCAAEVPAGA